MPYKGTNKELMEMIKRLSEQAMSFYRIKEGDKHYCVGVFPESAVCEQGDCRKCLLPSSYSLFMSRLHDDEKRDNERKGKL